MLNKLRNLTPLKKGGQKETFLAIHEEFGRVVFKKIIAHDNSLERTKREIRAATILTDTPFVPHIYAHNCDETNPAFIWVIEQYISGQNLRDILRSGRIFNINEVVVFLDIMLSIAIESEQHHLVHRDIKPENIMLDDDGNYWLLDFGIARHLDLDSLTKSNSPFGLFTLGYASSEQFRNLKKMIDIRADLFSIGVVCHELLQGQNFYVSESDNDVFRVIKKLENNSLPLLRIEGDPQFLLSTFISLLGDHRRNRRPQSAKEAKLIFDGLKTTLKLQ